MTAYFKEVFMIALFIILMVLYAVGIVLISKKLADIIKNPEKYDEEELVDLAEARKEERRHIKFFKSLSHQYILLVEMPVWLASTYGVYLLLRLFYKMISGDATEILSETWLIGVCVAMFILLPVLSVITLYIKTPFFAIMAEGGGNGTRRSSWRESFIMLLIIFTLGFPFFAFAVNNYIYYDDDGITSSAYFQIDETFTAYEDVERVEIRIGYDDNDPHSVRYHVTLSDGRRLDMSGDIPFSSNLFELHRNILEKSRAELVIEPLKDEEKEYFRERLSEERMEILLYLFEGHQQ